MKDIRFSCKIGVMKFWKRITAALIISQLLVINLILPVFAAQTKDDIIAENQGRQVETNTIPGWPKGPVVGAKTACLMDAKTGAILYAKDMDSPQFPASTTKVMTCLLAAENCRLDEMVTFSTEAVYGIERDSSNVGIDVGQSITMEEALYCIMLASANEVASAVAEHVGGSIEGFADMMNKRAAELGCTNTHFVNANGLHNDEHYTSAHDLCLIASAYFNNELLRKIASTRYIDIHATATQPDDFGLSNHHKMLPGRAYAYENIVGGKTGYTTVAHQTLVTCAEKGGMTLVCAVMRDEAPYQYTDTRDLFEYGFDNFKQLNIKENETGYSIDTTGFFKTNIDIFGSSRNIFSIGDTDYVTVPNEVTFDMLTSELIYDDSEENNILAQLKYSFNGVDVGSGHILLTAQGVQSFEFGAQPEEEPVTLSANESGDGKKRVFVDVKKVLIVSGIVLGVLLVAFVLQALLRNYSFAMRRRRNIMKKNKRYKSEFDDYDF